MDAKAAKRRSKEIDIALQKEQLEKNNRDRKRMSLILLGSGDSGKSTVLKQDTVQLLENSLTTNLVKSVYNDTDDTKEYAKNLAHDINELWRDTGIQQCYNERNKYKLQDTAA
ncbi:hypothetical protein HK099_002302 [Clydaea vesicula]|uniref:Uncharacterized protein n=1 Tax=Clydaea vesicula TaxID=447962 RepID=A0AAD5U2Z5_9FUNG|nr:hypothetical protein HK099_002302 [Clydaea vesicula]